MKRKTKRAPTNKEIYNYLDQISVQIQNNQKAVYDFSQVLSDYMEMNKDSEAFTKFMHDKYNSGSDAEIPTRWSVFVKSIKTRYLRLKKVLASYYIKLINYY